MTEPGSMQRGQTEAERAIERPRGGQHRQPRDKPAKSDQEVLQGGRDEKA